MLNQTGRSRRSFRWSALARCCSMTDWTNPSMERRDRSRTDLFLKLWPSAGFRGSSTWLLTIRKRCWQISQPGYDSRTVIAHAGLLQRALRENQTAVISQLQRTRGDGQAAQIFAAWDYALETMMQQA